MLLLGRQGRQKRWAVAAAVGQPKEEPQVSEDSSDW